MTVRRAIRLARSIGIRSIEIMIWRLRMKLTSRGLRGMSKIAHFLAGIVFLSSTIGARADCVYPDEVNVPDGANATEDEMLRGRTDVQEYMAAMNEYLTCLDEEASALGEDETPEQKELHMQRHNAAVEAMETLAAKFNDELRAFKSRD